MPYICLSRSDIPDGTVQVLDLQPNSSQGIPAYTPLGQTRYVNRAKNELSRVRPEGTLDEDSIDGLSSYLLDRVEPGGLEIASSTLTVSSPHEGDVVDLAGVPFTCKENLASGSALMVGPAHGDTLTLKTVVFNCVENYATGTAQVNGVSEADGDQLIVWFAPFTAKHVGPLGAQDFLDAQAPNNNVTSAASLQTQVEAFFSGGAGSLTAALTAPGSDTVRFTVIPPAARGLAGEAVTLIQVGTHFNLSHGHLVAAVPDPASQQFAGMLQAVGGTVEAVATSLALTINDATAVTGSQALMAAVAPLGVTATAATGGTATVTMTASARGLQGQFALASSASMTPSGAALVAAVPDPTNQEFAGLLQAVGGTNAAVATSLRTAILDPLSIVAMKAANPGIGDDGAYVSCAAPAGAVLTLRPWCLVTAVPTLIPGILGNLGCDSHAIATLVPDATTLVTLVLNRTYQLWSMTQLEATSAAILARLDAGSNLELADINTILLANAGGELTAVGGSNSTGVVRELLSILAGRGYRIKQLNAAGAFNQYMDSTNPLFQWNPVQLGGFTESYAVFGTGMIDGEIKPVNIGGDTENREVSGIRHTVDTDSFQVSLSSGTLARMCSGIDLWTRDSTVPFFPWTFQRTLTFPEVANVRVLTVYSDAGLVLA